MTDGRVRELERRWKATGAVEDEAAWLRERLRTGELDEPRIQLAAHLGHGAAGLIAADVKQPTTTHALIAGLERWSSDELLRRVGLALLRQTEWHSIERSRHAVRLLEADLACRCEAHWSELTNLPNPPYPEDAPGRAAARAARYALLAAAYPEDALASLQQVARSLHDDADAIRRLRAALVPWLLGYPRPS